MKNEHDEAKKLILGLLIGAVGAGTLYCLHAAQNRKTPVLQKIGKTISDIGEVIESCKETGTDAVHSIEKRGSNIASGVMDWVDSGLKLWKNLKQG